MVKIVNMTLALEISVTNEKKENEILQLKFLSGYKLTLIGWIA